MTTVFTNGCFDLLHPGHVDLLARARSLGTRLVVGINSDESVRRIKGPGRPVRSEQERAAMLGALRSVDEVRVFNDATPERLIAEIAPDVLVKGGDWPVDQIVGAESVLARGGKVLSLPLVPGYSSSALLEQLLAEGSAAGGSSNGNEAGSGLSPAGAALTEHLQVFHALTESCLPAIEAGAAEIIATYRRQRKVLLCGNGGSASDAQHIAAELVGRYEAERAGLPAIALTTDTSALTAISNDYGFERIFARQVEALAVEGDLVIGLSTSGNSPNVLAAIMAARSRGCRTLGLTGSGGKRLAGLCDVSVLVPTDHTCRIQEAHIAIGHIWCEMVDRELMA